MSKGKKFDEKKIDMSLTPFAMTVVNQVFMIGAKKYGRYNYLKGMDWHRPFAAAKRHMMQWWYRTDSLDGTDKETKVSHLFNAACELLMLAEMEIRKAGLDDRPEAMYEILKDHPELAEMLVPKLTKED